MQYWKTSAAIAGLVLVGGAGCFSPYETTTVENPATAVSSNTSAIVVPAIVSTTSQTDKKENDPLIRPAEDQYTQLELFKTTDNAFYFRRMPEGLGGYIIFDFVATPLIRLDRGTGVRTVVAAKEMAVAQDVSADDNLVAFVPSAPAQDQPMAFAPAGINILNQASSTEKFYPITITAPFTNIGMVKFSPDASQVAFAAAVGDPDHELGAVYTLNLESGKVTEVAKTKAKEGRFLTVKGWKSDKEVDYE